MIDYYRLIWFFSSFIIVFTLSFLALQALDFSKLFKKNSTWQIKSLIGVISMAFAFLIAMGLDCLLLLIKDIF